MVSYTALAWYNCLLAQPRYEARTQTTITLRDSWAQGSLHGRLWRPCFVKITLVLRFEAGSAKLDGLYYYSLGNGPQITVEQEENLRTIQCREEKAYFSCALPPA